MSVRKESTQVTGGNVQKWKPTTREADSSEALVAEDESGIAEAAILEREMEDVLDARIAVGLR